MRLESAPGGEEVFILSRSAERRAREQAIHARFERRIDEDLVKIEASCLAKKHQPVTIATRVGRLPPQDSRAGALFDVKVEADAGGRARLRWARREAWREWARLSEGSYLLRSSVTDRSPQELRRAYAQLTEAEAAFRVRKSDLAIRPVWHQKEQRVEAHWATCCGRRGRRASATAVWATNRARSFASTSPPPQRCHQRSRGLQNLSPALQRRISSITTSPRSPASYKCRGYSGRGARFAFNRGITGPPRGTPRFRYFSSRPVFCHPKAK